MGESNEPDMLGEELLGRALHAHRKNTDLGMIHRLRDDDAKRVLHGQQIEGGEQGHAVHLLPERRAHLLLVPAVFPMSEAL